MKKFLAKCEVEEQVFNVFTMTVYRMVIYPKVLNHIDVAVIDLVEQVNNQANPVPAIITKTIRSLNFCRKKGEGQLSGVYSFCIFGLEVIFGANIKNHSNIYGHICTHK